MIGTKQVFCEAFYHTGQSHEWQNVPVCLTGDRCQRFLVRGLGVLRSGNKIIYEALYSNCFQGISRQTAHAETFLVRDTQLHAALHTLSPGQKTLTFYCTYQCCHQSSGGRKPTKHSTSCTLLMKDYATQILQPLGITLIVKCCAIYRANWEDVEAFDSATDAKLYASRTQLAREGLWILQRTPGIKVESMNSQDWDYLLTHTTVTLDKETVERRSKFDQLCKHFLGRMYKLAHP